LWITSKRYFLRQGAVDNGIKVYSNAAKVTLTLNGEKVSTLENGQYVIPNGPWRLHVDKKKSRKGEPATSPPPRAYVPEKIDNVFFWPVALHTGKNVVTASDDQGHADTATIYFYGKDGLGELPGDPIPISGLTSGNAGNPAYYMDMPIHEQWPIYYDLDSNADNSWNKIPPEIENATWIALRRVTVQAGPPTKHDPKPTPDQSTNLSFTATKAENIYIMATQTDAPPAFAAGGQFKEVSPGTTTLWRNNDLLLVPVRLYVHKAAAGEKISLTLGDRDAIVMIK
jgi:hypothetical protein